MLATTVRKKTKIQLAKMVNVQELWRTFLFSDLIWSYYSIIYFGFYGFSSNKDDNISELFREAIVEKASRKHFNNVHLCKMS